MVEKEGTSIESILQEDRVFYPPKEFSQKAHVKSFEEYENIYSESEKDPVGFGKVSPRTCIGSNPGKPPSNGTNPLPNGSLAAR